MTRSPHRGASRDPTMVLHVLNGSAGGAALSTIGIIEELKGRGIKSAAVSHIAGNEAERKRLIDAVDGRALIRPLYWWNKKNRAPTWRRPFIEAKQVWRTGFARQSTTDVIEFAKKHNVDLIHTNTFLTPEGGLAAAALSLPHAWHLREMVGTDQPFRFVHEGRALGRLVERLSSVVVANAYVTASTVRSWFSSGHVQVAENALALAPFLALEPPVLDREKRTVVAMVGNVTSQVKNHRLFLDVAERMAGCDVDFHIYGHCPSPGAGDVYTDELQQRAKAIGPHVVFKGFVGDPVEIMRSIDIMLHPTGKESFGRIAVEAMASARSVIGIDKGGIGEVVRHEETGLLAPPGDAQMLSEHLRRLLAEPALARRFGLAGRRRAQSRYALNILGDRLQGLYRRILPHPVRPLWRGLGG